MRLKKKCYKDRNNEEFIVTGKRQKKKIMKKNCSHKIQFNTNVFLLEGWVPSESKLKIDKTLQFTKLNHKMTNAASVITASFECIYQQQYKIPITV